MPDQHARPDRWRRHVRRASRVICAATVVTFLCVTGFLYAQPRDLVLTHVAAVAASPAFYHGRTVTLQGLLEASHDKWHLAGLGDAMIRIVSPQVPLTAGRVEVVGQVLDIGRLTRNDPRLSIPAMQALLNGQDREPWPKPGELVVCLAQSVAPAVNFPAPSVRAIVLDPARYLDALVTVTGRFRGRNLLGDLPAAVGFDRWEFVLESDGAALWITNVRPRGPAFSFDPGSRLDTNKWVEVAGTVHHRAGIVWIEGREVRLAKAPPAAPPAPSAPPPPRPAPEILFSVPTEGEIDVSPASPIRIQASRGLDPQSFEGHIRAAYLASPDAVGAESTDQPPAFATTYDPVNRVVEIRFLQPLQRFRTIQIDLTDGIAAPDKAPLKPWRLRFTIGG